MCCGIVGHGCVWRGFEPRELPVRPAPVEGLTSDSIVLHALIDSLSFSVFDHARILTSGVYGARERSSSLYFCQRVLDASARSFVSVGASRLSCVRSSGCVRCWCMCSRWGVHVLNFVISYLLSAWRDFRVSRNESSWVGVVSGFFLRSWV